MGAFAIAKMRLAAGVMKSKPMKYDWITIAIANGGVLTASKNVHGITATMNWKGHNPVSGGVCDTLPEAMTSLNSELEDNAANEMP